MGKILKNLSILQKFLFINLVVFIFIIIITFFYLGAIKKNLINEKQKNHTNIITQTILNLEKSNIKLNEYGISEFLFSKKSRFPYFEKLDRVIFFDDKLNWIGDTRSIPSSTLLIEELTEEPNEKNFNNQENKNETIFDEDLYEYYLSGSEKSLTNLKQIQGQFFIFSIKIINNLNNKGFILISENADNIIAQIEERENFIIRTALVVLLVIIIFSYVLNRYFLKPIKNLVTYTKIIKDKSNEKTDIERVKKRNDELGILSKSLDEMTSELNKRITTAENYSTDLLHEIRNPLASLKSASEIISETEDKTKREKL
ncbi:sensor histidine kinase, partial [Candidatus Pelagibacter sp.]|nr:sensor histidine kinase [Candidatus Pelagibacter sp.]